MAAEGDPMPVIERGQVWERPHDGSRVRVEGFTRSDNPPWVKVREVGGDRARSSYPQAAFASGGFRLVRNAR